MRVAAVQLSVGRDPAANLPQTLSLVDRAIDQGAELVALPECANLLRGEDSGLAPETFADNPLLLALQQRAATAGVRLLIGSLVVALPGQEKRANRQVLIDRQGLIQATYDKLHLFDVAIGDGQTYRESSRYQAGTRTVVSRLDGEWRLGHSICYDVRFPELYRKLVDDGANLLVVPAAFTFVTGQAHWQVLLRSRAIETGSFVLAPAQCGEHWPGGRRTYGHSLIIAPWGEVLAEASEDRPEVILADLDLAAVTASRQRVPNLLNRRRDLFPDA